MMLRGAMTQLLMHAVTAIQTALTRQEAVFLCMALPQDLILQGMITLQYASGGLLEQMGQGGGLIAIITVLPARIAG